MDSFDYLFGFFFFSPLILGIILRILTRKDVGQYNGCPCCHNHIHYHHFDDSTDAFDGPYITAGFGFPAVGGFRD